MKDILYCYIFPFISFSVSYLLQVLTILILCSFSAPLTQLLYSMKSMTFGQVSLIWHCRINPSDDIPNVIIMIWYDDIMLAGKFDSRWKGVKDLQCQDLLLMTFPLSLIGAGVLVIGFFIYDRTPIQLIYAILPPESQNVFSFFVLLAFQFSIYNFSYSTIGFGVYLQLACFQYFMEFTEGLTV